jgi:DNA-binding CsgD family transcriptional regulator
MTDRATKALRSVNKSAGKLRATAAQILQYATAGYSSAAIARKMQIDRQVVTNALKKKREFRLGSSHAAAERSSDGSVDRAGLNDPNTVNSDGAPA